MARRNVVKHVRGPFPCMAGYRGNCSASRRRNLASSQKLRTAHTAYPMKHEPVGTNLFDATQAEEMVRYLIDGMPTDELRKTLVGNPSVEEWAEWIASRHNFCERNAGQSLEKYPWLRRETSNQGSQLHNSQKKHLTPARPRAIVPAWPNKRKSLRESIR